MFRLSANPSTSVASRSPNEAQRRRAFAQAYKRCGVAERAALDADYSKNTDSLRTSHPLNLLAAYLNGEFVNLTSGSV